MCPEDALSSTLCWTQHWESEYEDKQITLLPQGACTLGYQKCRLAVRAHLEMLRPRSREDEFIGGRGGGFLEDNILCESQSISVFLMNGIGRVKLFLDCLENTEGREYLPP